MAAIASTRTRASRPVSRCRSNRNRAPTRGRTTGGWRKCWPLAGLTCYSEPQKQQETIGRDSASTRPEAQCPQHCTKRVLRAGRDIMAAVDGTVAITDHGWYEFLLAQNGLDEVNFWTPSAHWGFRGEVGAPFFFKLKARYNHAICGFAYFARYARLPDWLAWETFGIKNGCQTLDAMRDRIGGIRARIDYRAASPSNEIGCIPPSPADVLSSGCVGSRAQELATREPATQTVRRDRRRRPAHLAGMSRPSGNRSSGGTYKSAALGP